MTPIIRTEELRYSFNDIHVLKGVSIALCEGEALIIAGRSGCGKSVFLEICAGLLAPSSGNVFWEGQCITQYSAIQLSSARRRIGFVFQKHALIHNFSIFDNIALPLRYHSVFSEREIRIKVRQYMEELGLFDVDRKFPNELSSGQVKCAALARALIMDPRILFADEPTAGVDPYTERCITNVINTVRSNKQMTVLMLCNDSSAIRHLQWPVSILDNGKLVGLRSSTDAVDNGQSPVIATFREML